MSDLSTVVSEMLRLVREVYPNWDGFSHPQFVEDEIKYKRDAVVLAQEQLERSSLSALLDTGDTASFITRLKTVANKTNLLYMGTPRKGDLAILNQPTDLLAICHAIFDLLHGQDNPASRLGKFCDFVSANQLPQRWTFPTYYLFLLYPQDEVFVKPGVTKWLSRFTGGLIPYDAQPSAGAYRSIRDGFHTFLDELRAFGAKDMIEVQSLVYVAHQEASFEEVFIKAVDKLRPGLAALETDESLRDIQDGRDSVYDRFRPLFSSSGLPKLTAETFSPFLDFKVNRHWWGIHRHKSRLTADMGNLQKGLALLADEAQSLAKRFDEAQRLVPGLGKATATPIIHVMYPDRYGVWNEKTENGLKILGILPNFTEQETEGTRYEVINELLVRLAQRLDVDLWTLDTLWEWLDSSNKGMNEDEDDNPLSTDPPPGISPTPPDPIIAREFHGFTMDAFNFLRELLENNNKGWMEDNRERWRNSVLEPMRALFADLGPVCKSKFDPYLLPDALEIQPNTQRTLAKIYKNWAATPDSAYYDYYWGAFYRAGLTRQTDAQLFVTIQPHELRFGFYFGESAKAFRKRFNRRVIENLDSFYALLVNMGIAQDFKLVIRHEDGRREHIPIRSAEDVRIWVESDDHDLLRHLTPEETIAFGPSLVDTIFDAFHRIFPIYLWGVADDPEPLVTRYLAAEFPPDETEGPIEPPPPPYTRADFLQETYLTEDTADELLELLTEKKQLIFYGPPGTGKTYVALRLAQRLIGLAAPLPERLEVVQFHPAYAYEEFIEGIRPRRLEGDGPPAIDYPVVEGAFVRFCDVAAQFGDAPCVFIIDEINRGNIPRIFGELMLLLEYRDRNARLPYSGRRFRIPPNVYLIGTMNTADRSIALVDFALRRRFHFFELAADPELFQQWLNGNPSPLPWLPTLYKRLTEEAIDDAAFRIGPSAFMRPGLDQAGLARVWRRSVMPYLREYYFDQRGRADQWAWDGELVRGIRGLSE